MVVDIVELFRMLRDGELKNGTIIQDEHTNKYVVKNTVHRIENAIVDSPMLADYTLDDLMYLKFEILSDEKEIKIQSIEEVDYKVNFRYVNCGNLTEDVKDGLNENFNKTNNKINELIKAVKQLDNKIKE